MTAPRDDRTTPADGVVAGFLTTLSDHVDELREHVDGVRDQVARRGTGELTEAVAAAVLAVPGVAELHGGRFGEVATYLPGRRVRGVTVADDGVTVHLVLHDGAPVRSTAGAVRDAVAALTPLPVHLTVQDVARPA